MNKRIKELAADAGYPDYMTYGQDKVLEKFAELIVKECLVQIEKQGNGLTSTEWDEGYRAGLRSAQAATKKHFGVEE